MKKKVISALLCVAMVSSLLIGCSSSDTSTETTTATETTDVEDTEDAAEVEEAADTTASAEGGSVYYLNFKPEQAEDWEALAATYTELTGVQVDVVTAASGTYESTLKSEMAKSDAPTLFQVNGPVGLATWTDYCYDLSGSEVYSYVKSDDFVLEDGGEVKAIAYVIETYGIIYNKTLLADYISKDYAVVSDVSEINNFETLKAVAESIQENKDDLGVEGAFTSAGMDSSSDWRFKTHLANLPIYYEYEGNGYSSVAAIEGTYLDNYKQVWDLYINNSTCAPTLLSSKTGDEAEAEFALGEAVFFQNGTWEYGNLISAGMSDDDLGMLPIYIGVDGEENQGLCTGSENYWCVNSQASEADIQATLDFLAWVITSDEGRDSLANAMGFLTPFSTFDDGYVADNALIAAADEYISDGKTSVAWCFTTMPSETWKDGVGSALTEYAAGTADWDAVVTAFVDGWATEYEAANS